MGTIESHIYIELPKEELEAFCEQYNVHRLALFGSVLGEDFGDASDIDLLVSFNPEARVGLLTLSKMQRELEQLFQRPVDLVPMEGLKPTIRDHVLASMVEVYAT